MATKTEWAVRTRRSGEFFAGFDSNGEPVFAKREADARRFDSRLMARAQALLLTGAQIKPVGVAA